MHAAEVLFQGTRRPLILPPCDHYAGAEKLMRKSLALQQELGPIFDLTFDCEDGAAAGDEAAHARLIGSLIASPENQFGRIGARVHDVHSRHFRDDVAHICELAGKRLAYLVLPKAEGLDDVQAALDIIAQYAPPGLPLHVLIESHGALHDAWRIAALPQVECLSFGIMDFVSAHHGAVPAQAMRSPGQFSHPLVVRAKLEIAAACHAHGKIASHNVCTEFKDSAQVAHDAARAAQEFAYQRMWSIHPNQIKPIVKAFTPRNSEVTEACAILLDAQQAQWGPIQQNGRLHDRASYRYYWTILQRAKAAGMHVPEAAQSLFVNE
ncbi:aldolase/citrate lyase family protein [Massilia sp. W12]|uniref:HpcH/HpaI aldolase/citrate lyase family protein n=1 Tax=Massilia sp. W12 TaxID=3126507 RepID=UPI0030CB95BC